MTYCPVFGKLQKMPPKPQVFKTPDGKEFTSKAEWRDYMMSTFYTFKDKVNEPNPLLKRSGEVDGQVFDISDCTNSTMAVLDHTEQVQIDRANGCRIFIGACASAIFIRNCDNCTFYVCCRQLRLREVVNCTLYVLSMAEVHIEESTGLQFAPFNGSYPEHGEHLKIANIDPLHNLWYDVYDHSDSEKSHVNWKLLPEAQYEKPWFPAGAECEFAVPKVKVGSVVKADADGNMQSFGLDQMKQDAQKSAVVAPTLPPIPPSQGAAAVPPLPPQGAGEEEQAIRLVIQIFASSNDVSVGCSYSSLIRLFVTPP